MLCEDLYGLLTVSQWGVKASHSLLAPCAAVFPNLRRLERLFCCTCVVVALTGFSTICILGLARERAVGDVLFGSFLNDVCSIKYIGHCDVGVLDSYALPEEVLKAFPLISDLGPSFSLNSLTLKYFCAAGSNVQFWQTWQPSYRQSGDECGTKLPWSNWI